MNDKAITRPASLALAVLNKAIDSCNKRAASVMADYQTVGVQALMHLEAHGDVGPVNRILAGMPKGSKTAAMGSWMLTHGALEANKDQATKKSMPVRYTKTKTTNVDAAVEDKWFDHLPEKAIDDVFDLSKALSALIAKAKADGVKSIKVNGVVIDAEAAKTKLEALAAFAAVK